MKSDDCYITASRYDIKSQSRNRRVFRHELVTHPWRAFVFAIGMCALAATASFNLVDAPQWARHPWLGWLLGGFAFLFVCYFLWCAVLGWWTATSNLETPKP